MLCCFIVDTIRFVELFGWRRLSSKEEEGMTVPPPPTNNSPFNLTSVAFGCWGLTALFYFWVKLGERMGLQDMPTSLPEAQQLVEDYVQSDITSYETAAGNKLTEAMTKLLCKYVQATRVCVCVCVVCYGINSKRQSYVWCVQVVLVPSRSASPRGRRSTTVADRRQDLCREAWTQASLVDDWSLACVGKDESSGCGVHANASAP